MSVQITINGGDAAEAVKELSALAAHISGQAKAPAVDEQPKQSRSRSANKQETVKSESTPELEQEKHAVNNEDEGSNEPIPTDVELRALAAEIGKQGADAKKAIKALLDQYGVPNITAVPDDQRVAFKAELEGLA